MAKKPTDDLFEKSTMTFGEHLEELRVCLFRSVLGIAAGCAIGFFIANNVVRFFQQPLERAMERFYIDRALGELPPEYGEMTFEVRRQILDEKLIPHRLQIDVGRLVEGLRMFYPEQFGGLELSPYWLTPGDLISKTPRDTTSAKQLAIQLTEAGRANAPSAPRRVWQLLSPDQQQAIASLASATQPLTFPQVAQLLAAVNQAAGKRELHESPEFEKLSGSDAATTTEIRKALAEGFDPVQSRRLNKLLIASVFPQELKKARVNLLPAFAWEPVKVRFQTLNAQEPFMIWMKAALTTGLVIASPYVFFQIWLFVAAGLYPHEKNYVYLYLPISIGLFFGGASLAFAFVFDPVLDFLFTFNKGMNADFDPRIGEWLSFVLILPLGFGISFQLPLVMLFLNRLGLVSIDFYIQQWRIAILVICVISMVLTPADPVSMLLMAVPLCFLYLLGIIMTKYMPRGRSPFEEAYEP